MIVEKDIARVSIGSYVVGIAKQHGDNVIKKQGWVRDLKSIEALIDLGVERVLVDTSKALEEKTEAAQTTEPLTPKPVPRKKTFAESMGKAKQVFQQSKDIQRKVLDDIINGRDFDIQPVAEITNETTELVFENPDALACIINIREKDEYLLEHSTSVAILISIFSRFLKLNIETTKEIAIGAFLHDVGKIMIEDEILNKPGKLTVNEFEVMKGHVNHSIRIIEESQNLSPLSLEVAAQHHEKLNGGGYPNGLSDKEISKFGRMIAICDIFDALTANRVYKDGMAHVKAFSILLSMANKGELDESLVSSFIKCMGVYPVGSLVKLNSEQLAVVETSNKKDPIRPRVKVFYSTKQSHFLKAKDVDLSDDEQKHIEKGVRAQDFDLDMNKILEFLMFEG